MYINTIYLPILTLFLNLGQDQVAQAWPLNAAQKFAAKRFDYIVVGGGTAGLVVANRLSACPDISVGVLEAGDNGLDEPIIYTPGFVGRAVGTKWDWNFTTIAQPELNNRSLFWSRGKALGGSSAINFYVWMRGNKPDYDAWASFGNTGWDYDSLVPYFKKPETFHEPSPGDTTAFKLDYDVADHGTMGPIDTSFSIKYSGTHQYWHETMENLDVERQPNGIFHGNNTGVWTGLTSVNPENRTRSYSASAYYRPYAWRPNLVVLCNAMVREVIIDTVLGHKTATRVKFDWGGNTYTTKWVKEEIIVSAGTVQSPQILELSGIGNPTVLAAAGIPLQYANTNVGEHLQDRIMAVQLYEIDPSVENMAPLRDPVELATAETEYNTYHTGLLTVLPTDFAYVAHRHYLTPAQITTLAGMVEGTDARTLNILSKLNNPDDQGTMEYVFDPNDLFGLLPNADPEKKYGTVFQMLQYPFSTGNIHIPAVVAPATRTTVYDLPVIDPKYYEGDGIVDLHTMANGQILASKIAEESPLSSVIIERVVPPPVASGGPETEEEWIDWLKGNTVSDWHPIGTCSMTGSASTGVVDPRLKVYGVRKLRVVDASIMPVQISSHLQGTVYAIAEKAFNGMLCVYAVIMLVSLRLTPNMQQAVAMAGGRLGNRVMTRKFADKTRTHAHVQSAVSARNRVSGRRFRINVEETQRK
ncbi:Dehydrogenase citC [Drechslerella dactyloides]|uniref:Dehydrogenase citC n=1 Tax=Drechslerella dactyloides TaxID=74499 RepID=A0AAD6IRZ9_DREDA|nr:Dehydrogenase citC [Drechslerella dactyloides]